MPSDPGTGLSDPRAFPTAFAARWHSRDGHALARLFAEEADFVNVVGLLVSTNVSPQYPHQHANDTAWLEDNPLTGNVTLPQTLVSNAMGSRVSRTWVGYWQKAA